MVGMLACFAASVRTPVHLRVTAQDVMLQRAHPGKVIGLAFSKSDGQASIGKCNPRRTLSLRLLRQVATPI
jgi:hypothetical protein